MNLRVAIILFTSIGSAVCFGDSLGEFTRQYNIDEIRRTAPQNPNPSFHQKFGSFVNNFFSDIRNRQAGEHQFNHVSSLQIMATDKYDYQLGIAALADVSSQTDRRADVQTYFKGEAKAVMESQLKESLRPYIDLNGITLNLSFNNRSASQRGHKGIKYGLLIKDIEPNRDAPLRAAVSETGDAELAYASKAKVHWTIGPVHEQGTFSPVATKSAKQDKSFWSTPDLAFSAKIVPDGFSLGSQDGFKYKTVISQNQGYYTYFQHKNAGGDILETRHIFNIPTRHFHLSRTMDEKLRLTEVAATNIKISNLPTFAVRYRYLEDQFLASSHIPFTNNTLELTARSKGNDQAPEAHRDENYLLSLNRSF